MSFWDIFKEPQYNVDGVLALDNENEVYNKLLERVHQLSRYGMDLSKLSYVHRVVLYVSNLQGEVNNGGFNQFYFNISGNYAHETHEALVFIGANKTADILKKANDLWPDQLVPRDRDKRFELLVDITKKDTNINERWNELSELIWLNEELVQKLMIDYVRKNKAQFK